MVQTGSSGEADDEDKDEELALKGGDPSGSSKLGGSGGVVPRGKIVVCCICFFVNTLGFAVVETILVPITETYFDWTGPPKGGVGICVSVL